MPQPLVGDRFELLRLAGTGGMGSVYEATDRVTGGKVALKLLDITSGDYALRMTREAQALAALRHPRIVHYVAHGTERGRPYVAMEWVGGRTLGERLRGTRLPVSDALRVIRHVAEALAFAHAQGIVHRDVKPSNVVLRDGEIDGATLIDFGVARLGAAAFGAPMSLTQTGVMLGTPSYMAPEQARGERQLDARADVFSLGCVLFRCLTGKAPFAGEDAVAVLAKVLLDDPPPLHDTLPDAPEALQELVDQLLSKDPAGRPGDGSAVVRAIDAVVGVLASSGAAVPARERLGRAERRLMCLVLVDAHVTSESEGPAVLSRAREAVAVFGARCELLASGALVAELRKHDGMPGQRANDLARSAARCALALATVFPDAGVALVTAHAVVGAPSTGDVFDRAAKLLRQAASQPGGGPVVDDITASLLDASFDVAPGDPARVHGETPSGAEAPTVRRTLLGRPSPFVGRERELGTLTALFEEASTDGVARVALVLGPAGIGKSRLREELTSKLVERARVLAGRADPMTASSAYACLGDLIRRTAGVRDGEPDDVRASKLDECLARSMAEHDEERARTAAFLGAIAHVPAAGVDPALASARTDPVRFAEEVRAAFERWMRAECRRSPVALVFEDMQWADLLSVRVLGHAVRALASEPFLLAAFARPEFASFRHFATSEGSLTLTADISRVVADKPHTPDGNPWEGVEVHAVELGTISKRAAERLVHDVLGGRADAEQAARLVQAAAGNPFFLEEIVRAFAQGRHDRIPDSVLAMAQTRLEALEPEARRVLRAASIFGETFWRRAVDDVIDDGGSGTAWLDAMVDAEILVHHDAARFAGEQELAFRHALLRDAAYAMLTPEDARTGHGLAAAWLENAGERDALRLAEHWERSAEPARASAHLLRAAEQATRACDFAVALSIGRRLRRLSPSDVELGTMLRIEAEAHRWRGETTAAEQTARRALERLEPGSPVWLEALGQAAYAASYLARFESLEELGTTLLHLMPRPDAESAYVFAAAQAAYSLSIGGRLELRDQLMAAYDPVAARHADDPVVSLAVWHARVARAVSEGNYAELYRSAESAAARAQAVGDTRTHLQQRVNIGYAAVSLGLYETARDVLRSTIEGTKTARLPTVELIAEQNLGFALFHLGELDEALEREEHVVELAVQQSTPRLLAAASSCIALIHLARGALDAAEASAVRAYEAIRGNSPMRCHAAAILCDVLLTRGRVAEALATAEDAWRYVESLAGGDVGDIRIRVAFADALCAAGRRDEAMPIAVRAKERVLERAARIHEDAWRRSFTERVPENARALRLAEELATTSGPAK